LSDVREREVKLLAMSSEQLESVTRRSVLGGLPVERRTEKVQEDTYVDTEDFRLLRAGLSLRHRRLEHGGKLTLKEVPSASDRALLRDRREVEEETASETPFDEPSELLASKVMPLVGTRVLLPLVKLRTHRTVHRVGLDPEAGATLCLDRVEVLGDDGVVAGFHEVEIEDDGLGAVALLELGQELRVAHGLQPSDLSKFERGLAARGLLAEARGEEEAFAIRLRPEDRMIDTAYRIFRRHFERMKANEAGTRLGEDIEFLHDMRVSTRRLRAAFRTFRNVLGKPRLAGFNNQLRWIAGTLGEVRDLDVYLERLPEYAGELPETERPALEPFRAHLEQKRVKARARMLRALDSRRYESFLARFDRFLRRGPAKRPVLETARLPVLVGAPKKIRRELKHVLRAGRAIPAETPPAQQLHDLRILCKRLRYTCEFFRELYGKGMRRFIRSVVELQDLLGAHQDACMAGDNLRQAASKLPARKDTIRLALVLGQLVGSQDRSAAKSRSGFRKAWRQFDRKVHRRGMWE
jgi:triphosphatase